MAPVSLLDQEPLHHLGRFTAPDLPWIPVVQGYTIAGYLACVDRYHTAGITRLHGFGVKITELLRYGYLLASADSLAWSLQARRKPALPGCQQCHRNCANCPAYALGWGEHLLTRLSNCVVQPALFGHPIVRFPR